MPYATQAQLIERFGESELIQLTDRADPLTGAIVAAVLDAALLDADQEIDSYLRVVRTLPLPAPIPVRLVRVAADVARYHLYDDHAPDEVRTRYEDAIRWLRDVAAGRASLGADDTAPAVSGRIVTAQGVSAYDWTTH
jgi:phage gp36-like protein